MSKMSELDAAIAELRKCGETLMAEPVSISIDCFGTNIVPKRFITNWICKHYDLTPAGIISFLGLRDVDYNMVSCGGHFRRSWMPWEK